MNSNLLYLNNLITIELFNFFDEYFFIIALSYLLIVTVTITYNIYGLLIQKAFSECTALFLLMIFYLILNDNLFYYNFLNFNHSFINDYFGSISKVLIILFSVIYFLIVSNYLEQKNLISFEYVLIILFCILGLLILCNCNDLLLSYLAIELSSLGFYILAGFKKVSIYSIESGLKYFIIAAISSSFFLLGSAFLYGCTGSINLFDFKSLLNFSFFSVNFYNNFFFGFLEIGLSLILLSLFIKIAAAPFHLYTLDIYQGAPTNSAFFFAAITKLSIFVILVRFCYQSFFNLKNCWQYYFLLVGSFSIFIGSFGGLKQRKIKTLLAYSSTTHIGYILIAFSSSTFIGVQMLLFYLIIYSISNLIIWYVLLLLKGKKCKHNKELSDLTLLKKSNAILALFFTICMFSIAGIPPLAGFLAKMNVFLSVIGISFYFAALISVFCSVISTFYYVRIIKILYFENCFVGKLYHPIKTTKIIILCVLGLLLIYLFFNPNILYLINCKIILFF